MLFGCAKNSLDTIDVAAITDLSVLQEVIEQVSEEMSQWTIAMEKAQSLIDQLQQKYVDLTDIIIDDIETTFATIQTTFDKNSLPSYTLPLWAKRLGMTYPKGMQLDKTLSKKVSTNDAWYSSTTLVYEWNYTIALEQAQAIAEKAGLFISKNFEQAQALAKIGDIDYISGLDVGSLINWIVYANHELLDTNMDNLLSVSVDQDGILTIEATKYKD